MQIYEELQKRGLISQVTDEEEIRSAIQIPLEDALRNLDHMRSIE